MITYIIKMILCSALFLLAYKLLFEKEKMHQFNRVYLLFGLVFPFVVPFLSFEIYTPVLPAPEYDFQSIPGLNDSGNTRQQAVTVAINYLPSVLLTIYITITTFMLLQFVRNLKSFFVNISNGFKIPYKNSTIVLVNENWVPHSFLNYIFINKKDYNNGNTEPEILLHELTHVRQKHSLDVLLLELMQVFFWFNPFLIFYRKAIRLNHEFLADGQVVDTCGNVVSYQSLLIDKARQQSSSALASQFNYLITKKRLIMMTKTTSPAKAVCMKMFFVPLLVSSVIMFSTRTGAQNPAEPAKPAKVEVQSTKEGASQDLLKEYEQIINRAKDEKGRIIFNKFSTTDKARLEKIFLAMSKEQQKKQWVTFMPVPGPLPRVVPTNDQIESWKDSKMYGLWINSKRVNNAVLANYKNTDFAQVTVSKLTKNAINYGKHYYQVDLMTIEEYETYYKQAIADKGKYYMAIRWNPVLVGN
jgi:bla regulator protein blaR1